MKKTRDRIWCFENADRTSDDRNVFYGQYNNLCHNFNCDILSKFELLPTKSQNGNHYQLNQRQNRWRKDREY